jgi:hypothetical protein
MDDVSMMSTARARPSSCDAMDGISTDSSVRACTPASRGGMAMDDVGTTSSAKAHTLASYGGNAMDGVGTTSSARPRTPTSCGGKDMDDVSTSYSVSMNEPGCFAICCELARALVAK